MDRQTILNLDTDHLCQALADKLSCWKTGEYWYYPDLNTGSLMKWKKPDEHISWWLEESLDKDQRDLYVHALTWVINRTQYYNQKWALIHATPDQRARAWLIVKSEDRG